MMRHFTQECIQLKPCGFDTGEHRFGVRKRMRKIGLSGQRLLDSRHRECKHVSLVKDHNDSNSCLIVVEALSYSRSLVLDAGLVSSSINLECAYLDSMPDATECELCFKVQGCDSILHPVPLLGVLSCFAAGMACRYASTVHHSIGWLTSMHQASSVERSPDEKGSGAFSLCLKALKLCPMTTEMAGWLPICGLKMQRSSVINWGACMEGDTYPDRPQPA